tara:strand:+ start:255 stop:1274 length:1020 start_codon:yes stop_codon:yes gene_type:complete
MTKLKNTFAIGCIIQWYEVDIYKNYIDSVINALNDIENKKNVTIDLCFYLSQNIEEVDDSQITIEDIFKKFIKTRDELVKFGIKYKIRFYPTSTSDFNNRNIKKYTIADYRREFNDNYCDKVDVLMWGETDSLIPKQTFEVLDLLHTNNINQNVYKYLAFFGGCKMWDNSWESIEHTDFTDKPFIENDEKNWWSLRYNMTIDEMNNINNKVEELDVRVVSPYKFNGCGLVISSDVVKSGVNIPKSMMLVHEDTAFQNSLIKMFDGNIPQFVFKNILLVHNRKHPKKRMYVKGENPDETNPTLKRESNNWYKKVWELDHHNANSMFNQSKVYSWEDVFND